MNHWSEIELLLSHELAEFLTEKLPELGGTQWWKNHVILQLTPSQSIAAQAIEDKNLRSLDLAALLRIALRNWSELAFRFKLDAIGQQHIKELQDARNRHAHRPVDGIPLKNVLKDIDSSISLLQSIDLNIESLNRAENIRSDVQSLVRSNNNKPQKKITSSLNSEQSSDTTQLKTVSLIGGNDKNTELNAAFTETTYIGIDFGTSTTVVSLAYMGPGKVLSTDTLELAQPDRYGGTIRDHRVNSVLAYKDKKILFGMDAQKLRLKMQEGKNVFSGFKMLLGVEIGPSYPRSSLRRGYGPIVVEKASDATTEFFRLLLKEIESVVASRKLQPNLKFAISVPASFEANQRRALLRCAENAGLNIDTNCLIDEPNAAFLSFMNKCIKQEQDMELAKHMKDEALNLLVYDFGAGTCDISILQISLIKGNVQSRNLSISKFSALGGQDIDQAIALKILVPQIVDENPDVQLTDTNIDEKLLPVLMPVAERLKIAANKWLEERRLFTISHLAESKQTFSDHQFTLKIGKNQTLDLKTPTMSMADFADAMLPFIQPFNELEQGQHIFSPVDDALSKSGLSPLDLHAVLFIGGSSSSPLIQHCVMKHLPDTVMPIVPRDLQSHVSTGASIHSLGMHGFGFNIVEPITSEPIFVVTRGGKLETIIPASARVPSREPFELNLTLDREGQKTIELPICVSSESKLLGLLRLDAPGGNSFPVDSTVTIQASLTVDKLLEIKVNADGIKVESKLLDPLANKELSHIETQLLEARQKYNIACLEANGRPDSESILEFAFAAQEAGAHGLAADYFVQVDAMKNSKDLATNINYSYSRAGHRDLSRKWAKIAYERDPCALTAFNLSCNSNDKAQEEKYLREALRYKPGYDCALISLGKLLKSKGIGEGKQMLESAIQSLSQELDGHSIGVNDCRRLISAARAIENHELVAKVKARMTTLQADNPLFDDDNLVDSATSHSIGEAR